MTGANTVHSADSKSLWNYTLSPGWTPQEIEVFIAALKKYGVGRWTTITKNRFLPGKTVAQMYNQCQRLLGQQSVAEFEGLRIRLNEVFAANAKIKGVKRKNNCIVNEGDKQTREMVLAKKKYNQETYGITDEEADAIVIPVLKHEDTSSVFVDSADTEKATNPGQIRYEKIQRLKMLAKELKYVEGKIEEAKMSDESVDASVSSEEESDSEEESTSDEETSSEEESDFFVVLFQGGKIFTGFGEFTFFHTFPNVVVDEGTFGVHKIELVVQTVRSLNTFCSRAHIRGATIMNFFSRHLFVSSTLLRRFFLAMLVKHNFLLQVAKLHYVLVY